MSNETTPVEAVNDLDLFSAELFGQSKPPEATKSDEVDETPEPVEDALPDTHNEDDDTLDTGDTPEGEAKPEPKKNRFQERIDDLVGKQREAERRAEALEAKLNETLSKLNQTKAPEPAPAKAESGEPTPDDKNDDGTDKYPLGEFDPRFLKDYTLHHIDARNQEEKQLEAKSAEQAKLQEEHTARLTSWNEKLEPARERYPDFQEKVEVMIGDLSGLEPAYGDYLSTQIMEMDHGTEVLYYLATHPDEARSIVDSGARKATLALGALEERLRPRSEKPVFKATAAPTPPPSNKGSAAAHVTVRGDEDDLDLVSRELFKKRRR